MNQVLTPYQKTRRTSMFAGAGLLAAATAVAKGATLATPTTGRPLIVGARLTADTATDAISKAILANPLTRITQGAPARTQDISGIITKNFPQLIEQNFAAMDPITAGLIIQRLSDAELSDMAQLYTNACAANKQQGRLLNVLANRLYTPQLGRLAHHFGTAAVSAAVSTSASPKTRTAFLKAQKPILQGPTPGDMKFGATGRMAVLRKPKMKSAAYHPGSDRFRMRKVGLEGLAPYLTSSPFDTYFALRVQPAVGLMSVEAALFSTVMIWTAAAQAAGQFGWWVGGMVAPVIETYAPGVWDAIGGTIDGMIQNVIDMFSSGPSSSGPAEAATAGQMGVGAGEAAFYGSSGGAYGETDDWYTWEHMNGGPGGGGGGLGGDPGICSFGCNYPVVLG